MKKQNVLIAILCYAAFAQAQEVFVTADFVSSYIWRGMDSVKHIKSVCILMKKI